MIPTTERFLFVPFLGAFGSSRVVSAGACLMLWSVEISKAVGCICWCLSMFETSLVFSYYHDLGSNVLAFFRHCAIPLCVYTMLMAWCYMFWGSRAQSDVQPRNGTTISVCWKEVCTQEPIYTLASTLRCQTSVWSLAVSSLRVRGPSAKRFVLSQQFASHMPSSWSKWKTVTHVVRGWFPLASILNERVRNLDCSSNQDCVVVFVISVLLRLMKYESFVSVWSAPDVRVTVPLLVLFSNLDKILSVVWCFVPV